MSLRVVQVNCVIDAEGREPDALLDAWHTIPSIARSTMQADAEVTVIQASNRVARFSRGGVHYRFVRESRWRNGSGAGVAPGRLAEAVRQAQPHIVHFNGLDFPLHARAVCATGVPVLLQDHASRPSRRLGVWRRFGHRQIAGAAFTSAAQAEPFRASRELPRRAPVFAVPESSTHFTPGDREEARRLTGVQGDPAILWIGHLDRNKDPLTILAALRQLLVALPGLQLWMLYGNAPLLPEVKQLLAEDVALAARVHLVGRVSHEAVESYARAADLFVSGSRREGSGYALIEAMACGAVPVVSDIPSFRVLTGDGAVGELVRCGDASAFATAILRLASQPLQASRAAVIDHFHRHLSFEQVGRRLVEIYRVLLNGRA